MCHVHLRLLDEFVCMVLSGSALGLNYRPIEMHFLGYHVAILKQLHISGTS